MAESIVTENHARALIQQLQQEIELVRQQIVKSHKARGGAMPSGESTSASPPSATGTQGPTAGSPSRRPPPLPSAEGSVAAQSTTPPRSSSTQNAISPISPTPAVSRGPVVHPISATRKEGTLLRLTRRAVSLGSSNPQLVPQYVVVDERVGVALYTSKESFDSAPARPQRYYRFWVETINSRGSRFKKAAVCWPLLLPEDGDEMTNADSTYTYFGIDFPTESDRTERIVFASRDPRERDDWVHFLTKYIDLYLAPRAESEELQHLPRGAAEPLHQSSVLEGEAPGGTVL